MRDKFILLFFPILLSGCGGGGGSSSVVVKNPPAYYETTEYNSQYGLSNIKASEVYSPQKLTLGRGRGLLKY